MGGFNLPMFVLFLLVTVIVAISLLIWSELSIWAVLVVAPTVSYVAINVFGFVVDLIERIQGPYEGPYPGEIEVGDFPEKAKKERLVLPKKPRGLSCPSCGSKDIAAILYGLPGMTEALEKAIANKEATLGGCLVHDEAPQWVCNACSHKFGRLPTVSGGMSPPLG